MLTKIRSSSLCFNAARGFVGGATNNVVVAVHAGEFRFNAARGFVGGATKKKLSGEHVALAFQCRTRLCGWCNEQNSLLINLPASGFNAARGFVGGATLPHLSLRIIFFGFNAARGFVGGATVLDALYGDEYKQVSMPHAALWVVQP